MQLGLAQWDQKLFYRIVKSGQNYRLQPLALLISASGNGPLYLLLSLMLLVTHSQGDGFFYLALASFAIELPLYLLLKNAIRRHRPCHSLIGVETRFEPSDKFSLPSGHSAAAFLMATVVYVYFPLLAPIAFIWAAAVGLSRVVLGVHYPLDILAGMSLGISAVWCAQVYVFN